MIRERERECVKVEATLRGEEREKVWILSCVVGFLRERKPDPPLPKPLSQRTTLLFQAHLVR